MNNIMEYQSYVGSVEFSQEDSLFYGKVMGIRSLISYEGTTAKELVEDFHRAVEDYLLLCKETGQVPEKPIRAALMCGFPRNSTRRQPSMPPPIKCLSIIL